MHLLIVEDHAELAATLRELLAARGHDVEVVADGESAFDVAGGAGAGATRFDVIVLDRILPGLDGLTLCRRLREERRVRTPILMLTARDSVADRVAGLEAGADDYLVKPFALAELEARLRALGRRVPASPSGEALVVADLRFDPATLQATRGDVPLRLNPSTRRILGILMRNTHRVVSRAELEQALWGDAPPEGDVLRAHVYALRTAVDRPHARKLLHTVHGEGYRLADLDG